MLFGFFPGKFQVRALLANYLHSTCLTDPVPPETDKRTKEEMEEQLGCGQGTKGGNRQKGIKGNAQNKMYIS